MRMDFKPYLHEHNLDVEKRFIGSNGIPKLISKFDLEWKSGKHKVQSGIFHEQGFKFGPAESAYSAQKCTKT